MEPVLSFPSSQRVPAAVTAEIINYTPAALGSRESWQAPACHALLTDTPLPSQELVSSLAFRADVRICFCCSLDKWQD